MFTELTGLEYLKAEIACKHDKAFEKETWADRLAHFDSLDLKSSTLFKNASNPIGLRAALHAYNTTLEEKPTGYMISLDATSHLSPVKPDRQEHVKLVIPFTHTPLLPQRCSPWHQSIALSQCAPVNPAAQLHVPLTASTHVPCPLHV